jgi:hypothetical protein
VICPTPWVETDASSSTVVAGEAGDARAGIAPTGAGFSRAVLESTEHPDRRRRSASGCDEDRAGCELGRDRNGSSLLRDEVSRACVGRGCTPNRCRRIDPVVSSGLTAPRSGPQIPPRHGCRVLKIQPGIALPATVVTVYGIGGAGTASTLVSETITRGRGRRGGNRIERALGCERGDAGRSFRESSRDGDEAYCTYNQTDQQDATTHSPRLAMVHGQLLRPAVAGRQRRPGVSIVVLGALPAGCACRGSDAFRTRTESRYGIKVGTSPREGVARARDGLDEAEPHRDRRRDWPRRACAAGWRRDSPPCGGSGRAARRSGDR